MSYSGPNTLGVKNGTLGTVRHVDLERRTLAVETDRGPTVELSSRYLQTGNLRHGYALTGHAAQGLTVERSDPMPDERLCRRLLEHKQRALTKTRETAERKAELAQRNLARCAPLRRRARAELRAEVALQHRALTLAWEQLAETAAQIDELRLRAREVNRTHGRSTTKSRHVLGRGHQPSCSSC